MDSRFKDLLTMNRSQADTSAAIMATMEPPNPDPHPDDRLLPSLEAALDADTPSPGCDRHLDQYSDAAVSMMQQIAAQLIQSQNGKVDDLSVNSAAMLICEWAKAKIDRRLCDLEGSGEPTTYPVS